MPNASFRSQTSGVVSDTLYIILKQFLAPEGKAAKAFHFVLVFVLFFVFGFVFKEARDKMGAGGQSPVVKVELVNLEKYLCGLKEKSSVICL